MSDKSLCLNRPSFLRIAVSPDTFIFRSLPIHHIADKPMGSSCNLIPHGAIIKSWGIPLGFPWVPLYCVTSLFTWLSRWLWGVQPRAAWHPLVSTLGEPVPARVLLSGAELSLGVLITPSEQDLLCVRASLRGAACDQILLLGPQIWTGDLTRLPSSGIKIPENCVARVHGELLHMDEEVKRKRREREQRAEEQRAEEQRAEEQRRKEIMVSSRCGFSSRHFFSSPALQCLPPQRNSDDVLDLTISSSSPSPDGGLGLGLGLGPGLGLGLIQDSFVGPVADCQEDLSLDALMPSAALSTAQVPRSQHSQRPLQAPRMLQGPVDYQNYLNFTSPSLTMSYSSMPSSARTTYHPALSSSSSSSSLFSSAPTEPQTQPLVNGHPNTEGPINAREVLDSMLGTNPNRQSVIQYRNWLAGSRRVATAVFRTSSRFQSAVQLGS